MASSEQPATIARPPEPGNAQWWPRDAVKPALPTAARPLSARSVSNAASTPSPTPVATPGKVVRLPMYCSGMTPITQPTMRPMRPVSAAPTAGPSKPSTDAAVERAWADNNAWVMGGSLIHHKLDAAPKDAGGRTQGLLKSGKVTPQQLQAQSEKRAKLLSSGHRSQTRMHRSRKEQFRMGGSFLSPRAWQTNMLAEGSAAQLAHVQSRRDKAEADTARDTAEAEARAEALAQRVAESAERLAARVITGEAIRERRHEIWVESRLKSGLTKVLAPRDHLTRRAIHLAADSQTLAHALVPKDFDGGALPSKSRVAKAAGSAPAAAAARRAGAGEERVRRRQEARALAEQQSAMSQELAAMVAVVEVDGGRRHARATRGPNLPPGSTAGGESDAGDAESAGGDGGGFEWAGHDGRGEMEEAHPSSPPSFRGAGGLPSPPQQRSPQRSPPRSPPRSPFPPGASAEEAGVAAGATPRPTSPHHDTKSASSVPYPPLGPRLPVSSGGLRPAVPASHGYASYDIHRSAVFGNTHPGQLDRPKPEPRSSTDRRRARGAPSAAAAPAAALALAASNAVGAPGAVGGALSARTAHRPASRVVTGDGGSTPRAPRAASARTRALQSEVWLRDAHAILTAPLTSRYTQGVGGRAAGGGASSSVREGTGGGGPRVEKPPRPGSSFGRQGTSFRNESMRSNATDTFHRRGIMPGAREAAEALLATGAAGLFANSAGPPSPDSPPRGGGAFKRVATGRPPPPPAAAPGASSIKHADGHVYLWPSAAGAWAGAVPES